MRFSELLGKVEENTLVLVSLSDTLIQNLGFDLGYDADFDQRGWDIDSWMENTFEFSLNSSDYYDLNMIDNYIDGFSSEAYFGDKEVLGITVGNPEDDYGTIALLVSIG